MNREDVEALLAACERDRIGPHPSNETLAALCRRWLEVEDAEVAHVEPKNGLAVMHERCVPLALMGKRVRIVPEDGKGESRE